MKAFSVPHFWLCDVPGTRSLDPDGPLSLGALHDAMAADRLLDVFFYDGVPSRSDFIRLFQSDERWTYAAFREDGRPLVLAAVTGMTGKSGLAHFCYLRAGLAPAQLLAREWLLMLAEGGMRSLLGLTPAPFRHALAFAESVGFRRLGRLPGACVLAAHRNRVCDGVLTMLDMTEDGIFRYGGTAPMPPQGA